MTEIKWGKGAKKDGNELFLNHLSFDDTNLKSHLEVRKLQASRIDGYIDGKNAYKFTYPLEPDINKVRATQYTLSKGDEFMSDKTDQYNELKEDLRESERRISNDFKEREQRFERETVRREERFEKYLEHLGNDAKEREERYMKSVDEIKKIVSEGESNRKSATIAMWTLAITTIIGIAAMVITVVLAV